MLRIAALLSCALLAANTHTKDAPRVAIIIDDIGYRAVQDQRVLALPNEVAIAVLPYSPNARRMAMASYEQQRPVLVHMPMEANNDASNAKALGPGALTEQHSRASVIAAIDAAFDAVPHARGLNNHMGSRLTRSPDMMRWLMHALACRRDSYFVDSFTTAESLGLSMAEEMSIPAIRRHVFLDHVRDPEALEAAFARLIKQAHRNGAAVAIGHPFPETLALLESRLPTLAEHGIELVTPEELAHASDRDAEPELVMASW
ncbi:MAG: divergent polysaccharide deacetylase family protein [Pseudomonadota bacterium]